MGSFLQPRADLTVEEAGKLGMKNEDDEVEKFVQANTQELGKDKWLCPLSGKKFKGPDFVRKHIFNKHAEKVEEVISHHKARTITEVFLEKQLIIRCLKILEKE